MTPFRRFNITVNNYQVSGSVSVQKNCNSMTYTNIGDEAVTINDIILFPSATPATILGDSVSIGGNEGEVYKGNIRVKFAGGGAAPNVQIIQKFYLEDQTEEK